MQVLQITVIVVALCSAPHVAADDELRCFEKCFATHAATSGMFERIRKFFYGSALSRAKRSEESDALKARRLFAEIPLENICDSVGTDYAIATCCMACPHGAHRPVVEQYAKTLSKYCDPSTDAAESEKFWLDGTDAFKSMATSFLTCPRMAKDRLLEGTSSVCRNYTGCMEAAAAPKKDFGYDVMVWLTDSFRVEAALMFSQETPES
ncbi:hypothetical protein AAVH_14890 [Aphelenchoides avenae]|nr:hypothetical protein AAVH_14890 [Aphelenchus avenae]